MSQVTYQEKAFLQLVGRRLLRYTQDAESRGETYNDLSGFSPLQCGARVKFRFESTTAGPIPVATIRRNQVFSPGELKEIASELLDAPVKLRASTDDDLEYVREIDAPG